MRLIGVMCVGAVLGVSGCDKTAEVPISQTVDNSFVAALESAGYTPHVMPGRIAEPGSLVYVREVEGRKVVEWVDSLAACGVPEDVIGVQNGALPAFSGTGKGEFSINASASVPDAATASGSIGSVRKAELTVTSSGVDVIRRLAVANWLTDPLHRAEIESYCLEALDNNRTAVIVDAAYVDAGTFSFHREDGVKVEVTAAEVGELVDLGAGVTAQVSGDGTMTINQKIYVAFKEAFYLPASGTLAQDERNLQSATADLEAALE